MKKTMCVGCVSALLSSLYCTPSYAEQSPWSLNVTGFSWHEDASQRNRAHQANPGLGIRYDISSSFYTEANFIWKNSVKGKTQSIGLGYHKELTNTKEQSFKVGTQIMWMHYENPTKGDRSGYIPALTLEYRFTNDIGTTIYIFPKKNESVALIALNISF